MAFGIPGLDDEHRHLVVLINDLNHAIASGAESDKLVERMNVLLEDTLNHFSREETILTETEYPSRKGHKLLHERLTAELEHVKQDGGRAKDTKLWPEYGLLIRQIFLDHFRDETRRYKEFHASKRPPA